MSHVEWLLWVMYNIVLSFIASSSESSAVNLLGWSWSLLTRIGIPSSSGGREAKGFLMTKFFLGGGGLGCRLDFFQKETCLKPSSS
jgi:hypothetical protein